MFKQHGAHISAAAMMVILLQIAPGHHPDHVLLRKFPAQSRPDLGAVAQNGDPVGDPFDLVKPVRNIDEPDTFMF